MPLALKPTWLGQSLAIVLFILGGVGCTQTTPSTVKSIDLTLRDKDGMAALEFGPWMLVFESVRSEKTPVGTSGYIYYHAHGSSAAWSSRQLGDLTITQSFDKNGNVVKVNQVSFTIHDGGDKLVFVDAVYQSRQSRRTIFIKADGTTGEWPDK